MNSCVKVALLLIVLVTGFSFPGESQIRCASNDYLNARLSADPAMKSRFLINEEQLLNAARARLDAKGNLKTNEVVTIPIVFHVLVSNSSSVTDNQIKAQLDTLNKDFGAYNAGLASVPDYFKALIGNAGVQFCLAQRTPDGAAMTTPGIMRYSTSKSRFIYETDEIKVPSSGGVAAWDPDRYVNVWIGNIYSTSYAEELLGYATFPGTTASSLQGVAIHYSSLPNGAFSSYNAGKTLTHEMGHFFNLYHIWGDDENASNKCSGSDLVDDTPNQAIASSTCSSGVRTDACTTTSPGIMYQNFMDYTVDRCLFMFTQGQVARMLASLSGSRSALKSSNACTPLDLKLRDASAQTIVQPAQRTCDASVVPRLTIRNSGSATLTSLVISGLVDGGGSSTLNWTGSLASGSSTTVTLPAIALTEGSHTLQLYTSRPNGDTDLDTSNDTLSMQVMYYAPLPVPVSVKEGFESTYPAERWDLVTTYPAASWQQNTVAAKTGSRSVRIRNFTNTNVGQTDYLRSATFSTVGVDSLFINYQIAAATYTATSDTRNASWDTLQVLVSTDCGLTYTSVLKQWGSTLKTRDAAVTTEFVPNASDWKSVRLDLTQFVGNSNVLVAFLNKNGNENDIYLDDINIYTVTVNPNVKAEGFVVSPNPTSDRVAVQFYPHPTGLRSIEIYSTLGQLMYRRAVESGAESGTYSLDVSKYPAGMYVIKVLFDNRTLTRKIIVRP